MPYTQDLVDELNILVRYNLTTTLEGIKVHKTASPEIIAATRRLFEKGLLSQEDGGYLTNLGRETAEQAQAIMDILRPAQNLF
ncbi:TIGR02647 family protein [Methylobacter svalbardensis]|uniref:TIGR02647 family protein n=1 Tax=Methylobacter svalbardensis TaxID=3080016 RepID=UPI0030EDBDBC